MKDRLHDSRSVDRQEALKILNSHKSFFTGMSPIATGVDSRTSACPGIKAVLFDIYGTILISQAGDIGLTALDRTDDSKFYLKTGTSDHPLLFNTIRNQLTDIIKDQHIKTLQQLPEISYPEVDIISVWNELYINNGITDFSPRDLTESALLFEITSNRVDIMPGSAEVFSWLKESGIPMGIVSNAQFYTPILMEYLFKTSLKDLGFQESLESWSYMEKCGKPDPLIFKKPIEVLEQMGIRSNEVLYIGNDMLNDVSCASGFGLKTALFAGDKRSLRLRMNDPRVRRDADYIITDLLQLKQIIQEGTDG